MDNTFLPQPLAIPGPSSSSRPPTEVPLPEDNFPPPNQLAARVARPAQRVAGVHHSDSKGKGKENEPIKMERKRKRAGSPIAATKKHKGRAAGAANYTEREINYLLDLLEDDLPLGGKGWNTVADKYNEWADACGRPQRTAKSLENKFKQVCADFVLDLTDAFYSACKDGQTYR